MAITDLQLVFSDGQAETTQAAHDSDTKLDMGTGFNEWGTATIADYGETNKMWLHVRVSTAWTTSASGTLAVALQDSADNSSFAAVTPALGSAATAAATLVAGYSILRVPLPHGLRRYLKLVYTIGTGAMTAGAVDAWIGPPTEVD